jgi:hypothetical protein
MKKLFHGVLLLLLTIGSSPLWAQNQVAVYQESSPGSGNFNDNFLGCISVFDRSESTAAEIYQYDIPYVYDSYGGLEPASISNTSQLFFVNTVDGGQWTPLIGQPEHRVKL